MNRYRELHIIKHALSYYIERPNASELDIAREKRLLENVTEEINGLKEKYGIKLVNK